MATLKSDIVTNSQTIPLTLNQQAAQGGSVHQITAIYADLTLIALNDVLEIAWLPAHSHIVDIKVNHTEMAAGATLDIGVRTPSTATAGSPTTLSKDDTLSDGYDVNANTAVWVSVLGFGTNGMVPGLSGKRLWEQAGVATEPTPGTVYAITGIAGGADWGSTAEVLAVRILYTMGE